MKGNISVEFFGDSVLEKSQTELFYRGRSDTCCVYVQDSGMHAGMHLQKSTKTCVYRS